MTNKDFHSTEITFPGLGFLSVKPDKGITPLYAAFFYAHHGGYIEEINAEIVKRGLRPMTHSELRNFFANHHLSLLAIGLTNLLATAPEDIKPNPDNERTSLMPGIWSDSDKYLCGSVLVQKIGGKELIGDHQWTVLAIDESKKV